MLQMFAHEGQGKQQQIAAAGQHRSHHNMPDCRICQITDASSTRHCSGSMRCSRSPE